VRLGAAVADADLVITGEGSLDFSSLRGKVVSHVAALAMAGARPCVVLAGSASVGRREAAATGIDQVYAMAEILGQGEGLANPAASVRRVAASIARDWSQR
jgi:glycerate kinase